PGTPRSVGSSPSGTSRACARRSTLAGRPEKTRSVDGLVLAGRSRGCPEAAADPDRLDGAVEVGAHDVGCSDRVVRLDRLEQALVLGGSPFGRPGDALGQ